MNKVSLVNDGLEVSEIIWGAMRILDSEHTNSTNKLACMIDQIADVGITTIDIADIYGNYQVEEALGTALKQSSVSRDKLQIITKCGIRLPSQDNPICHVAHYDFSTEYLQKQIDRSLRKLQLEQIDLLLLHRPDYLMHVDEVAEFLDNLIKSGKAAHVGVSNFTTSQLNLLNSAVDSVIQTNQIEISPYHNEVLDNGTLEQCQQLGIKPMAWSPFRGLIHQEEHDHKANRLKEVLWKIAQQHNTSEISLIALAWILKLPAQPIPIIGTTNIDRIRTICKGLEINLSHEQWYEILIAARGEPMP